MKMIIILLLAALALVLRHILPSLVPVHSSPIILL